MNPSECKELIKAANIVSKARGGKKGPVKEEKPTIDFAYASVVSIQEIKEGEKFSSKNIWVKRPGTGEILAEDYESILGKTASVNIPNDIQIKKSFIK